MLQLHPAAPRSHARPRRPTASRSTLPRCRRTSLGLRVAPSSRSTKHRARSAALCAAFRGSAAETTARRGGLGSFDGVEEGCSGLQSAAAPRSRMGARCRAMLEHRLACQGPPVWRRVVTMGVKTGTSPRARMAAAPLPPVPRALLFPPPLPWARLCLPPLLDEDVSS